MLERGFSATPATSVRANADRIAMGARALMWPAEMARSGRLFAPVTVRHTDFGLSDVKIFNKIIHIGGSIMRYC